jgi:hypothetical protein
MIGCGLGGGVWSDYREEIAAFARTVAPARVAIYRLATDAAGAAGAVRVTGTKRKTPAEEAMDDEHL